MKIDCSYYEDLTRISNSNIGWFLNKGPAYLHKMLTDPPPEEKNTVLERGTMIHEYLLQPGEFRKDYVIWDKSRPSSAQQEKFCQALASSLEIEPDKAVLSAYKEAYSTRGKSDDLMLSEGLKIASTLKDYINFLKTNDSRKMISVWDWNMLEKIKHNISKHKLASKLIWPGGYHDYNMSREDMIPGNTWHEFHINWEWEILIDKSESSDLLDLYKVKCKSLLDGLTLDFRRKIATICDLKTTQKLWHFEDSMDQYDYCRQLMYYCMAVKWYLKNELNEDPNEWDFDFYIIGIDTTGTYEIRVFKIEPYAVESRQFVIEDALVEIAWHQRNNKWDYSRAYYEGDGSESLKL